MNNSQTGSERERSRSWFAVLPGLRWRRRLPDPRHERRRVTGRQIKSWSSKVAIGSALLLLPHSLPALDPAKSVFQFQCRNWTRQDGLPADKISTIVQTQNGYVWLGTQNGLVRFDGFEFKVIPIDLPEAQGQDVGKLNAARDGGLWFAIKDGGFGHYDGRKFSAITNAPGMRPQVTANTILEARDGAVWTGTPLGLGRWVKGHPKLSFLDDTPGIVMTLSQDAIGRTWVGTAQNGLFYWADGKLIPLRDAELTNRFVRALASDANGQLWVGTELGLRRYDANGQPQKLSAANAPTRPVNALLFDRHGVLWLGTLGGGLARYQNGQFTYLQKADGLVSDDVTSLLEDAEGSLWVGTQEGVSQLTDVKFPTFTAKDGLLAGGTHTVSASSDGGLWLSANTGASYFDGQTFKHYTSDVLLPNRYVRRTFEAANGDVYLGDGNRNINVLRGEALSARYTAPVWPDAFAEDDESILVGVGPMLCRIRDGQLQPYEYLDNPPPTLGWINNLCVAKDGAIWAATADGLFRIKHGRFEKWSTTEGLSSDRVQYVFEDLDGSIWAGLPTGMARLKDHQLRNITAADGLHDERVFAIVPDDLGYFWIASGRGFFRVARQSLNNVADGKSKQIQCEVFEGLDSIKFADRTDQGYSGCKALNGRIWFPNGKGVVMIDPARLPTNPIAPPVHIERVRANGSELARSQRVLVPPGQGELEFRFVALSFIAPEKVRFRYRLEGYDKDWVNTSERRLAFYTNLKPGRYTFRVVAANADGIWNDQGDWLEIELLPHVYQTAWFSWSCGGLTLAALAALYGWRVNHLKHKQQTLQKARDLLETANAALKSEIEERKRMQQEVEQIHRELLEVSRQAGMAEVATSVLHNVGNVLNSVNVTSSCVADSLRKSKAANLFKVVTLLREHEADLGAFLTSDPKGKQLPGYLGQLAEHLNREQTAALTELAGLQKNIEHIKDIVTVQQGFAKGYGVSETLNVTELVEDALRMNRNGLAQHNIQVIKEFKDTPLITVEKHKVLQILVNLVRNAKHACEASDLCERKLTIRTTNGADRVRIVVGDNGVGILPENLVRIFSHGFSTKKDGHGFGLHSGALAAREMGGSLTVHSDGAGQGAEFTLELPAMIPTRKNQ